MNFYGKIEGCKEYYNLGTKAYAEGNYKQSKDYLTRSYNLAKEIAMETSSLAVQSEYLNLAQQILEILNTKFNGQENQKPQKSNNNNNQQQRNIPKTTNDDINYNDPLFQPIELKHKVTFADVAGLDDVKEKIISSVINPLKYRELAKKYHVEPGAKVLLYGPPGTGKTFVAKAIAGEINSVFFNVKCQDFISKYLGESGKYIKRLFQVAKGYDAATIFFDEFDAISANREDGNESPEIKRTVATLLTEINGFSEEDSDKMLLLIACTNRPWAIDPAMKRGGRFGTQIYVGPPDFEARKFMLKKYIYGNPVSDDVDFNELSNLIEGFSGGDIEDMCKVFNNGLFKKAIPDDKGNPVITRDDFLSVIKDARPSITQEQLDMYDEYRSRK